MGDTDNKHVNIFKSVTYIGKGYKEYDAVWKISGSGMSIFVRVVREDPGKQVRWRHLRQVLKIRSLLEEDIGYRVSCNRTAGIKAPRQEKSHHVPGTERPV